MLPIIFFSKQLPCSSGLVQFVLMTR